MLKLKAGSKIHPTSQQRLVIVVVYVHFSLHYVIVLMSMDKLYFQTKIEVWIILISNDTLAKSF